MGFFFMVNLCLGTGFLGIPFSFFYTGYLAAIPTLLVIGIVSWLNSLWLLEVMARAQVNCERSLCMNSLRYGARLTSRLLICGCIVHV